MKGLLILLGVFVVLFPIVWIVIGRSEKRREEEMRAWADAQVAAAPKHTDEDGRVVVDLTNAPMPTKTWLEKLL